MRVAQDVAVEAATKPTVGGHHHGGDVFLGPLRQQRVLDVIVANLREAAENFPHLVAVGARRQHRVLGTAQLGP